MNYKKKLKSYKKIKGGAIIPKEVALLYGINILASLLMEYCVELYIWCINFLKDNYSYITEINLDLFMRIYYSKFNETYSSITRNFTNLSTITYVDHTNIDSVIELVYKECIRLLASYNGFIIYNEFITKDYINYILKALFTPETRYIMSCNNLQLSRNLIKLYALYCLAAFNALLLNDMESIREQYGDSDIEVFYIHDEYIKSYILFYDYIKKKFNKRPELVDEKTKYFNITSDIKAQNIRSITDSLYNMDLGPINMIIRKNTKESINTKAIALVESLQNLIRSLKIPYTNLGLDIFNYKFTYSQAQVRQTETLLLQSAQIQSPRVQQHSQIQSPRVQQTSQIENDELLDYASEKDNILNKIKELESLKNNPQGSITRERKREYIQTINVIIDVLKSRLKYFDMKQKIKDEQENIKKRNVEEKDHCVKKVNDSMTAIYDDGIKIDTAIDKEIEEWDSTVNGNRMVKISIKSSNNYKKFVCYDIFGLIKKLYYKANLEYPELDIYCEFTKTKFSFCEVQSLFKTIYESYSHFILEQKYEILFILLTLDEETLKFLHGLNPKQNTDDKIKLAYYIKQIYYSYNYDYSIPDKMWYQDTEYVRRLLDGEGLDIN